jgi:hypothetical protein
MGGSSSKKPRAPIIVENVLDPSAFMLIDCNGERVVLKKEVLDSLAKEFNVPPLDPLLPFSSKCKIVRQAIKDDRQKKLQADEILKPELTRQIFNTKTCEDLVHNYTQDEWMKFYNAKENKDYFEPWSDIISTNLPPTHIWDLPVLCSTIRNALISKGDVTGTAEEQKSLQRLKQQVKIAQDEADALRTKIYTSVKQAGTLK